MKFSEHLGRWLEVGLNQTYRASFHRPVRSYIQNHILPFFAEKSLDEITAFDCDMFAGLLEGKGLAVSTRTNILFILKTILDSAVKWGNLAKSPWAVVMPERVQCEDFDNFVQPHEVELLMETAWKVLDEKAATLVWLAFRLALRPGEAAGIKKTDLDASTNTLKVCRKVYEGQEGPTKGRQTCTYSLTSDEMARLRKRAMQSFSEYLFPNEAGKPLHHSTVSQWVEKVCQAAGLRRITPHGLRHTALTTLAASGTSAIQIQHYARHARYETSERYIHLASADRDATGEVLSKLAR